MEVPTFVTEILVINSQLVAFSYITNWPNWSIWKTIRNSTTEFRSDDLWQHMQKYNMYTIRTGHFLTMSRSITFVIFYQFWHRSNPFKDETWKTCTNIILKNVQQQYLLCVRFIALHSGSWRSSVLIIWSHSIIMRYKLSRNMITRIWTASICSPHPYWFDQLTPT